MLPANLTAVRRVNKREPHGSVRPSRGRDVEHGMKTGQCFKKSWSSSMSSCDDRVRFRSRSSLCEGIWALSAGRAQAGSCRRSLYSEILLKLSIALMISRQRMQMLRKCATLTIPVLLTDN